MDGGKRALDTEPDELDDQFNMGIMSQIDYDSHDVQAEKLETNTDVTKLKTGISSVPRKEIMCPKCWKQT